MAKPKVDFKKLFMEKGEKIAIIAAGVLAVFMIVLMGRAIATSASTDEKEKGLKGKVSTIQNAIRSSSGEPSAIPPELLGNPEFPALAALPPSYFVDLSLDNTKRGSPTILAPIEFQLDLIRAPLLVYGFTPDGEKIIVLQEKEKNPNLTSGILGDRLKKGRTSRPSTPAPSGPPAGGMPGPPGMPGPGMPGPGMPGGGMPGPGMPGPGMPGGGGFGGTAAAAKEYGLVPVLLKDFAPEKYRAAQFVKPVRMIVVSGSFPFKKQLEEFQKALRYNNLAELFQHSADMPAFRGFNVERQIRSLDGSQVVSPWAPFNWLESYKQINTERILEDYVDDDRLIKAKVIPPPEFKLCLPLPVLAGGRKYPKLHLPMIENTIEAVEKSGSQKYAPAGSDKFKGEGDPFAPSSAGGTSGNKSGSSSKDDTTNSANDALEALLIRFVDVNITPGYSYEYRIQIRCSNPNLGKDKLVGRPDYAKAEELVGSFVEIKFKKDGRDMNWVPVPVETDVYAYATDSKTYVRPDHARLHVQTWADRVRPDKTNNYEEQIGDWIMDDLDVGRGQYIAGTRDIKLPVWDPKNQHYIFKELTAKTRPSSAAKKGTMPVDFNSGAILVDFEGGKSQQYVKGRTVVEDAGMEMLIMTPDGRLVVRSSTADYFDSTRANRWSGWNAWQEMVRAKGDTKPAGAGDNFSKPPSKDGN